jgi:hypothetical protein
MNEIPAEYGDRRGDRGDLGVCHRDSRIERGEFQMLLMLLRAIVAER